MSLDVYLRNPEVNVDTSSQIFVRMDGQTKKITRAEWDALYPGREPIVPVAMEESHEVYSANITHNLAPMANAAGVYEYLWRPDELGLTKAGQLILALRAGLTALEGDPDKFKALNPKNGWGDYEGLVEFVRNYLAACEANPDADVSVSR